MELTISSLLYMINFTIFCYVYLISYKYEALECFKCYSTLIENQLNTKIKSLRIDRRHEYLFESFKVYCEDKCIARQLVIPYFCNKMV